MSAETTPIHVIADTSIAIGSVAIPIWVYQISQVAGMITVILGMFLVFFRLLLAIRDWRRE